MSDSKEAALGAIDVVQAAVEAMDPIVIKALKGQPEKRADNICELLSAIQVDLGKLQQLVKNLPRVRGG